MFINYERQGHRRTGATFSATRATFGLLFPAHPQSDTFPPSPNIYPQIDIWQTRQRHIIITFYEYFESIIIIETNSKCRE